MAPSYAEEADRPIDIAPNIRSRISQRNNLFEEMFNTLKMGYSNDNLKYVSSLLHYYLATFRYLQQYRNSGQQKDNNVNDPINAAIHYMKENIEKHITLQDISDYIGYSPSHFSMLFKKKTGHSPLSYSNLLKIQQACFMLDSTDMKVNQISFKIGIDDSFYFSRLFTKLMGMSPSEYRQSKKG